MSKDKKSYFLKHLLKTTFNHSQKSFLRLNNAHFLAAGKGTNFVSTTAVYADNIYDCVMITGKGQDNNNVCYHFGRDDGEEQVPQLNSNYPVTLHYQQFSSSQSRGAQEKNLDHIFTALGKQGIDEDNVRHNNIGENIVIQQDFDELKVSSPSKKELNHMVAEKKEMSFVSNLADQRMQKNTPGITI